MSHGIAQQRISQFTWKHTIIESTDFVGDPQWRLSDYVFASVCSMNELTIWVFSWKAWPGEEASRHSYDSPPFPRLLLPRSRTRMTMMATTTTRPRSDQPLRQCQWMNPSNASFMF
jgi:hypothetical protein